MNALINGMSVILEYFKMIIDNIGKLFEMLLYFLSSSIHFYEFVPAYMRYGIMIVITIAVVKLLVSTGGSES